MHTPLSRTLEDALRGMAHLTATERQAVACLIGKSRYAGLRRFAPEPSAE